MEEHYYYFLIAKCKYTTVTCVIGEFVIATAKQTILSMLSVRESLVYQLPSEITWHFWLLLQIFGVLGCFAMLCMHVVCDKNSMRTLA